MTCACRRCRVIPVVRNEAAKETEIEMADVEAHINEYPGGWKQIARIALLRANYYFTMYDRLLVVTDDVEKLRRHVNAVARRITEVYDE